MAARSAGALEDRAGGGAEAHAHFARYDLGEGGLAQAGGAVEEDVVQRLAARAGGLDEDGEVFAEAALAGEVGQGLRAERAFARIVFLAGGVGQ